MDLDLLFEEQYKITIPVFFKKYGEEVFRICERKILHSTTSLKNTVIATGGGTPCHFDNMEFINEGMILTGTVRNVIDFGAFVDIGVKNDGLVHISELSEKFVKNPMDVVSVGDLVKVRVIKIDLEKTKVSLSMKDVQN